MRAIGRARGMAGAVLVVLVLGGCAAQRPPSLADPALEACIKRFAAADHAIRQQGLRDEGEARVPGFPYLRANRLLASFAHEADDGPHFVAWISALAELDARARVAETSSSAPGAAAAEEASALDACRTRLVAHDIDTPARRHELRTAVAVPDDYLTAWRAAGLYPVSSLFMQRGIAAWHEQARRDFATPLDAQPVRGELRRWNAWQGPEPVAAEVRALVDASRDALGVPRPDAQQAGPLLDGFAPVWEVDVADRNDLIGKPLREPALGVDPGQPQEYRMLAHTRWQGRVLLQLVYAVWFAARPGEDIYAGALDGLIWRVTLGPDGAPLVYDSIHACGCYHQFFPGPRLRLRGDLPVRGFERPLVPQEAPTRGPLVVRLAAGTHYIQRVRTDENPGAALPLAVRPYDALRSGGEDSQRLFGAHGLVEGSERPERFLLWTAGIRSPGAMRQWGRHPTAFVGRRHFDDARLLESLFEEVP